ncbi:hypothetical protein HAV22_21485 [Massilia sp. TW-1]|uniref:Uncharacterized protein n=1 Tax=Telluria antibiotica TaxID=2717319 RepID=A0ABX0PIB9_9BURK|nr:hypothetical protein [Telluria antibiotica]
MYDTQPIALSAGLLITSPLLSAQVPGHPSFQRALDQHPGELFEQAVSPVKSSDFGQFANRPLATLSSSGFDLAR